MLLECELIETNWDKIRFESMSFGETKFHGTTFANLEFSELYSSSFLKLHELSEVQNSQAFHEAIKKMEKLR